MALCKNFSIQCCSLKAVSNSYLATAPEMEPVLKTARQALAATEEERARQLLIDADPADENFEVWLTA